MLVWLTDFLANHYHIFKIFHYLTLRAILSCITALVLTLILGPKLIIKMTNLQWGQPIREVGPERHHIKKGTPTMGGLLILSSILITSLLWSNLANKYVWILLLVTLGFGLIGGYDDYKKLILKNSKGLSARYKFIGQSILALFVGCYIYFSPHTEIVTNLLIPFFKNYYIYLGPFFIVLAYFVIVGTSNAVNLTDGLDGLAILPTVLVTGGLGIFAYLSGHANFAEYLLIPYIPGIGEVVVICGAVIGAGLGFLWFNTYPAQIFMGDVGSLALGGMLGTLAVLVHQEIVLFIMGGVFVAEAMSVILQVAYFKYTGGKRIFLMSPLHHHFELKGWEEPKIIVRFWIITFILVLIGLSTLKIR